MVQCHYEALGVAPTATPAEIKIAYRRLCMETHPDVAGVGTSTKSGSSSDRFKRISEAYSVLGTAAARGRYDFETEEARRFGFKNSAAAAARRGRGMGSNAGGGGLGYAFASGLPRNVLVGSLLGLTAVAAFRTFAPSDDNADDGGSYDDKKGGKKMVEAWKNPKTGRFELPTPWDATYRKLNPVLQMVPREEVHVSQRSRR